MIKSFLQNSRRISCFRESTLDFKEFIHNDPTMIPPRENNSTSNLLVADHHSELLGYENDPAFQHPTGRPIFPLDHDSLTDFNFRDSEEESSDSLDLDPEEYSLFANTLRSEIPSSNTDLNAFEIPTQDIPDTLLVEQRDLETLAVTRAVDRYRQKAKQATEAGAGAGLAPGASLTDSWFDPLRDAIREEFSKIEEGEWAPDRSIYGPHLIQLRPEVSAVLTLNILISEILKYRVAYENNPDHQAHPMDFDQDFHLLEQQRYGSQRDVPPHPAFANLCVTLGLACQAQINEELLETTARPAWEKAKKANKKPVSVTFINVNARKILSEPDDWSKEIAAKVGAVLIQLALQSLTIIDPETEEPHPAFSREIFTVGGKEFKTIGILVAHPLFFQFVNQTHHMRETWPPRWLPMVHPPLDWIGPFQGTYLTPSHRTTLIRSKGLKKQIDRVLDSAASGKLHSIYRGLNILSKTPWIINKKINNIVREAWYKEKGGFAALPYRLPTEFPPAPTPKQETDPSFMREYRKKVYKTEIANRNTHSQSCDVELKLEVSQRFENKTIYFPHNVDFRGRAYPIPPHLNHMGNDLCRSLLLFKDPKPLGRDGLYWLKIHLANVYGKDKLPFSGRTEWVEENWDNIRESVKFPIEGSRWWNSGEDPWQSLAACHELVAATGDTDVIPYSSPQKYGSFTRHSNFGAAYHPDKISEYKTHFPVHMDGSCNGLAHYSAMGRDEVGAAWVNMTPRDRPQDVYSQIASEVNTQVDAAAKAGLPIASLMQGHLKRKVVKQTVMTSVYGVTFVGARLQVQNRLKDIYDDQQLQLKILGNEETERLNAKLTTWRQWHINRCKKLNGGVYCGLSPDKVIPLSPEEQMEEPELPLIDGCPMLYDDDLYPMARFIAKTTLASLGETFRGANNSMQWLTECAGVVAGSGVDVEWTSPMGLPIVQPYRRQKSKSINTVLQNLTLTTLEDAPVNVSRQKSAFPPNFVHSIDGTHMFITALACHEELLSFAAVHDSFWSHPCDIPRLNAIIREQFIQLHSRPLLQNLYQEFRTKYPKLKFTPPPPKGNFDLNIISDSDYFFN